MIPKKHNKQYAIDEEELFDSLNMNEAEDRDAQKEEPSSSLTDTKSVSPEQLRIDSLRIAMKLCKLFDSVSAEDLLEVSSAVSSFLINHKVGDDYDPNLLNLGDNKAVNGERDAENEDSDNNDSSDEDYPLNDETEDNEETDFTIDDNDSEKKESDEDDLTADDLEDNDEESESENESESGLPNDFFI